MSEILGEYCWHGGCVAEAVGSSLKSQTGVVVEAHASQRILLIRGSRVIVDADLAELYGVHTKRLNEQVKRNRDRFPADFMFQLTAEEKEQVVANCDHLVPTRVRL